MTRLRGKQTTKRKNLISFAIQTKRFLVSFRGGNGSDVPKIFIEKLSESHCGEMMETTVEKFESMLGELWKREF